METIIDQLLSEQRELTAVERFSQKHDRDEVPVLEPVYRDLIPLSSPGEGEQYAFEVDLDACTGCKACVAACHSLNGLEETESWRDVGLLLGGTNGDSFQQHVTTACHHCVDPACANGCPVLAYEKDEETGIVHHLDDQCIGCQYCVLKCPYDVPKYSHDMGIVRKCDMCHSRLQEGEAPACVQSCPNEAIKIRVVRTEKIVDRSQDGARLVPTAIESDYTRPTTTFTGEHSMNRGETILRAGHEADLTPQHGHLPLVWMLTWTQISVGWMIAAWLTGNVFVAALSVAAGSAGLAGSILHLGQPLKAWKAFLGFRKSWLSREIMAFGVWMPLTMLWTALLWLEHPLASWAGLAALGLGAVSVFCSAMVYIDTRRPFWGFVSTTTQFTGTCAISAASIGMFLGTPWALPLLLGSMGILAVDLVRKLLPAREDTWSPAQHSARVLLRSLRVASVARGTLPLLALLLFLLTGLSPWFAISATGLICVSELLGRYLFFRAVAAWRMPGGLN